MYKSLKIDNEFKKVINFLYNPMFFDDHDIKLFQEKLDILFSIINDIVDEYLKNSKFRDYFNFSSKMEELIMIDPGYSNPVPIGRFDLFYNYDENFKFCELNGDGSSAMNEANTVESIIYESKIINKLKEKYRIKYKEL